MSMAGDKKYIPESLPPKGGKEGLALAFWGKKLLMKTAGNGFQIPSTDELHSVIRQVGAGEYIGRYDGNSCFCMQADSITALPAGIEPVDIMKVTAVTGEAELFMLAGTANHILHWRQMNQYCGRCGHAMTDKTDERAKICPACGNVVYPRISPATITAVFRGNEILLAHNRNFRGDMHSLIAGFVEPGETLERCAAREIGEEVGIRVKNIQYFSSQPWPFPDSLMMAFTAEYESGEISADGEEITKAAWFDAHHLPEIPSADSIAGKIIRWYCDRSYSAT